ncbi:MAG: hypothetical protein LWX83_12985 [Anaerolineae bacterium]|nr:hypothetical protein [Anaerolineae bacterium]
MSNIIEMIKQLREASGAGIMDCRLAWEESQGSYPRALEILREKAEAAARKHADQETLQGAIEIYSHANGRIGVMLEMQCQSDFAARSAAFRKLMHETALQIAAATPLWVSEQDVPVEILQQEKDKTIKMCCCVKPAYVMTVLPSLFYWRKFPPAWAKKSPSGVLYAGNSAKISNQHPHSSQMSSGGVDYEQVKLWLRIKKPVSNIQI